MTNNFENSTENISSKMSIDEIKEKYLEYTRLFQRIQRNGDLEEKKKGRKQVSPEHKRATYERTLARKKELRQAKALLDGRVYARGRPVKISIPTPIQV